MVPLANFIGVAHPWLIIFALPGLALLFLRRGGSLRMSGLRGGTRISAGTRARILLPRISAFIVLLALALGAAGLGKEYVTDVVKRLSTRIIVALDQSGSMSTEQDNVQTGPTSILASLAGGMRERMRLRCVFKDQREELAQRNLPPDIMRSDRPPADATLWQAWETSRSIDELPHYPRIEGACRALELLFDTVAAHAKEPGSKAKHQLAFVRFGSSSAMQEPLTSDYAHAIASVSNMDWLGTEVGFSTNTHLAVYDLMQIALKRHLDGTEGFTQFPSDVSAPLLDRALLRDTDPEVLENLARSHSELIATLATELVDTALIIITDATSEESIWKEQLSLGRLFRLAELFHMPVYVISTESYDKLFDDAVKRTGTPERRGEFLQLNKIDGYRSTSRLMERILDRALARTNVEYVTHKEDYGTTLGWIALIATFAWFLLSELAFGRTLTA
jgi:hypothetical protein